MQTARKHAPEPQEQGTAGQGCLTETFAGKFTFLPCNDSRYP